MIGAVYIAGYSYNFKGKVRESIILLSAGFALSVLVYVLYNFLDRRRPRPRAMRRIVECLNSADSAQGTLPGSRERIKLARHLNTCSKAMEIFAHGPWDIRFTSRILRMRARKLNQLVRDLSYPALLGGRRDLNSIKAKLGRMAYMIAINNWADIVIEVPTDNSYERVRGAKLSATLSAFNFTFVAMAALPAIPIIVQALRSIAS